MAGGVSGFSPGTAVALVPVDYSQRTTEEAVNSDVVGSANPGVTVVSIPNLANGTIIFPSTELLKGTSIETPILQKDLATGTDIYLGVDAFEGAIGLIDPSQGTDGFIPNNSVVAVSTVSGSNAGYYVSYQPNGGWPLARSLPFQRYPRPAILVHAPMPEYDEDNNPNKFPDSPTCRYGGFKAGETYFIHLLSDSGGAIGKNGMPFMPAKSKNGEDIILTTSEGPKKVAATVVFRVTATGETSLLPAPLPKKCQQVGASGARQVDSQGKPILLRKCDVLLNPSNPNQMCTAEENPPKCPINYQQPAATPSCP